MINYGKLVHLIVVDKRNLHYEIQSLHSVWELAWYFAQLCAPLCHLHFPMDSYQFLIYDLEV